MKNSGNIRIFRLLSLLLAASMLGFAMADYNSQSDVYLQVENRFAEQVAERAEVGSHGATLFEAQEGVHDTFSTSTGEEVDHYYIWICIGGECVPVDPFEFDR